MKIFIQNLLNKTLLLLVISFCTLTVFGQDHIPFEFMEGAMKVMPGEQLTQDRSNQPLLRNTDFDAVSLGANCNFIQICLGYQDVDLDGIGDFSGVTASGGSFTTDVGATDGNFYSFDSDGDDIDDATGFCMTVINDVPGCDPIPYTTQNTVITCPDGSAGDYFNLGVTDLMLDIFGIADGAFYPILTFTATPGGCGVAPSWEVTSPDGTVCCEETGVAPATPECDGADTSSPLDYVVQKNPTNDGVFNAFGLGGSFFCTLDVAGTIPADCAAEACPAVCDQVYSFATDEICTGTAPTFAIEAGCDPGTLDPFGLELDLDFYIYAPGGVPQQAPACYDPLTPLGGVSDVFPIPDPDLILDGGVGGTWNGTICADYVGTNTLVNNTCAPIIVTYVILPWDRDFDTDGDNTFGEYNIVDMGTCGIICVDVTIYPTLSVNVVDDGATCGTPTAQLLATDGTICDTATGAACTANGTEFDYDFNAADLSGTLDCAPDLSGTLTCAACPVCDQVYSFAADEVCTGEAPTFAIEAGCDPGTLDPFGLELDLDFYIYAPGGVPQQAPACYDPLTPLGGISNVFPIPDPDLILDGGVGGTWNGTICADYVGFNSFTNNTCDPIIVTFVILPWSRQFDSDGDNTFGEYNIVDLGSCTISCVDVTIYPTYSVTVIDDGSTCGAPTVNLVATDGTVCDTDQGTCDIDGDTFAYDFNAADMGDCVGDLTGTLTCQQCCEAEGGSFDCCPAPRNPAGNN